jgi:hypothetical protein
MALLHEFRTRVRVAAQYELWMDCGGHRRQPRLAVFGQPCVFCRPTLFR